MAFVFVLLGGMLGAMVYGIEGALVGAVLAPFGWMLVRQRLSGDARPVGKESPGPDVAALAERVRALEAEVGRLREQVDRTSQQPASEDGATIEAGSRVDAAAVATPIAEAAPAATPVAEPLVDLSPGLTLAPIEVIAEPTPPADLRFESDLEPMTSIAEAAASIPTPTSTPSSPTQRSLEHPPSLIGRLLFGGNTIVKAGVLVLFFGLAFLLRYAAERVTVPVTWRYAAVALAGAVLLSLGWRLRGRKDAGGGRDYGVILQGAGIGVFYLTALAAIKLHPLLSPPVAFILMAMVAVLGAVLAVMQDAPWLAFVSVAEGFAAPVLVSTGGDHHIALFTYLMILDVGIFLMAWFRAWRPLNMVGAVGTFVLTTAWAQAHYDDAHYASVQFFLLLFYVLFTVIGILFARRALAQGAEPDARLPLSQRASHALNLVGRVDSTLTFGVPLAAYGLQYLLVRDMPRGAAWSAFGFALFHLLLGAALLRRGHRRYSLLGEAHAIVGVIFGTLTIPLALEGVWTGSAWAVEAAGMYWLGARQKRLYARVAALPVLAGAAARLAYGLSIDVTSGTPLLNGSALGMAMLAASASAMFLVSRRTAVAERSRVESINDWLLPGLVAASLTAMAWLLFLPRWAGVATSWLGFAGMLVHSRFQARAVKLAAFAVHLVALIGLASSLQTLDGAAMLAGGWQGFVAAMLIGVSLLLSAVSESWSSWRSAEAKGSVPEWPVSGNAGLLLGLGVVALSLLFVMPADDAALAWPWLGVAAFWLALRIAHPALAIGAFALQAAAGVALLGWGPLIWFGDEPGRAMAGPLVLTVAALVCGDLLQCRNRSAWTRSALAQWAVLAWTIAWWTNLLPPQIDRELRQHELSAIWPAAMVLWVLFSSMLMHGLSRWRRWPTMGFATAATLPAWMLLAAIGPAGSGLRPSVDMGWLAWPLALGWHLALVRMQEKNWSALWLRLVHVAGFWFFVFLASRECMLFMEDLAFTGSAWSALGDMLVPALVLVLITQPSLLGRWPLRMHTTSYLAGATPLVVYLLAWLWTGNLQSGDPAPLPYVPLLNPLEMAQGLALLAIALWLRALPPTWRDQLPRNVVRGGAAAIGLMLYTGMVLRTCHHWADVPWDASALFASMLMQAALSVAWSAVGVGAMLFGHRRIERAVWIAGAALLAVVVVKLFLVELADRGSLYRIVSFIVVGVLLLVVGYFAPLPPGSKASEAKAPSA